MLQERHYRFSPFVGSIVFALLIGACGGSPDSTGGSGGAGTTGGAGSTGAGGTTGGAGTTGNAGTTGSAGSIGTTGGAGNGGTTGGAGNGGTTGAAGTMGAAGTTGTAGRGGTTGAAGTTGTAGRGGTTGSAGTTGAAGRGGSSGTTGGAGTTGAAGTGGAGRGGTTGTGGVAGTGGGSAGRGGTTGAGGSSNPDGGNWDAPSLPAMVTIHIAGDSTAAIFPATDATMRVGWGAVLDPLFDSTVTVDDAALSGRSTKSYIDEGAWTTLQAKIKTGDYLFIEFGHNDEKSDDPARYTDPATTYRTNLKTFINGARARGGVPVLMTSICRRQFSGSTVTGTHGAYTTAVFAVGQETGTPVVDMETLTKNWLMMLGPTASVAMFATDDNTHTNMQGAVAIAKLAVTGIPALGLPLAARALP